MCKAHDALAIVLLMHKGKLESFEQDTRGRLLLAALMIHRTGLAYIEEVGWWNSTRPAIEKMRKLVPELVPYEEDVYTSLQALERLCLRIIQRSHPRQA